MKKWGQWGHSPGVGKSESLKSEGQMQRWKKASMRLQLFMAQRKNPEATMTGKEWKAGRRAKVDRKEVEELTRQALARSDQPLYLFDEEDERLVRGSVGEK